MAKPREEQFKELKEKVSRLPRTSVLKKMRRPDWESMISIDQIGESGQPDTTRDKAMRAYQRKEEEEVAFGELRSPEVPDWLKAKITKRNSPQEVLDYIMARVRRAPSRKSLLLAQYILNDLGRRQGGSKTFKRTLTKAQVEEIISLSNTE